MNQLGKPIPEGKYVLNGTLIIDIEQRHGKLFICMEKLRGIEITTSIQEDTRWKVWYLLNKKESIGTLEKALKL